MRFNKRFLSTLIVTSFLAATTLAASAQGGIGGAVGSAVSALSGDAGSAVAAAQCNYSDVIAKLESGGEASPYTAVNQYGYMGKYQMGRPALIDAGFMDAAGNWTGREGVNSQADFLANPAAQEAAHVAYNSKLDSYIENLGLAKHIGSDIGNCGAPISKESIRGAMHLIGPGGAQSYFNSGGTCGKKGSTGLRHNTTDGNNKCARDYACAVATCNSNVADAAPDMSKNTCSTTMPMIEAISCSNFSGELRSFCQQTRPHLMTRDDCASAERMAESAPKGANFERCKNMTFGQGTGSWAFALACSYASEGYAVGDGGAPRGGDGSVTNPQCRQELEALGIEFDWLGSMSSGTTGGVPCMVENAVSYRGGAVPFSSKLTMTCETALAMEKWGQQLAGMGVTGYYGMGTLSCRPMIDKRGERKGTVSEHGLGRAVDLSGMIVGGRQVSFGAIHQPGTPDGTLAARAKDLACSTFRGVLSPLYEQYAGKYVHFHVEWGKGSFCR